MKHYKYLLSSINFDVLKDFEDVITSSSQALPWQSLHWHTPLHKNYIAAVLICCWSGMSTTRWLVTSDDNSGGWHQHRKTHITSSSSSEAILPVDLKDVITLLVKPLKDVFTKWWFMVSGHFKDRVLDFSLETWSISGLVLIMVKSAWISQYLVWGGQGVRYWTEIKVVKYPGECRHTSPWYGAMDRVLKTKMTQAWVMI